MQAWQVNLDIQPVFNHHKAVIYVCAYFSKGENETSEGMKEAVKDAINGKKSDFQRIKAVARVYTTKRECSVQEAVYLVMPVLWLRKTFSKVLFLNSNIPEKRYRILRNKKKLMNNQKIVLILSNVIYWIDILIGQTTISWVEDIVQLMPCVLQNFFHPIYYAAPKSRKGIESYCQPIVLHDELME